MSCKPLVAHPKCIDTTSHHIAIQSQQSNRRAKNDMHLKKTLSRNGNKITHFTVSQASQPTQIQITASKITSILCDLGLSLSRVQSNFKAGSRHRAWQPHSDRVASSSYKVVWTLYFAPTLNFELQDPRSISKFLFPWQWCINKMKLPWRCGKDLSRVEWTSDREQTFPATSWQL